MKNEKSLKNQTGRVDFLKTVIFTLLSVFLIVGSCNEEDDSDIRIREVDWDLLEDTTIEVGEVLTITGKVTPANHTEKKFFLNSSNSNIAAVDGNVNGANVTITVTGVSPGVATISITMTESDISKSIDVTVKGDDSDDVYLLKEISQIGEFGDHNSMGEESTKFEYDDQNRITKIIYYFKYDDGDVYTRTETLSYNSAGDLVSLERKYDDDDDVYTVTATKNGNIIIYELWEDEYKISEKYELNDQELPVKITQEGTNENGNWWKDVYTYQYQDGNLIKIISEMEENWNGKYSSGIRTTTLTYDDKKAPFYHCNTPQWFLQWCLFWEFGCHLWSVKNNVKTISEYEYSGNYSEEFTMTHTYNDAGFSISRVVRCIRYDEDGNEDYDEGYEYTETFKYDNKGSKQTFGQNSSLQSSPGRSNAGDAPLRRNSVRNSWKSHRHGFGNSFETRLKK